MASQISNLSLLGTSTLNRFTDGASIITWANGAPSHSVLSTQSGVEVSGMGNGFEFTALADTAPRIMKVYGRLISGQGNLEVSLSDDSIPSYSTLTNSGPGGTNICLTITYAAASAGQSLKVKWVLEESSGTSSFIGLNGASLASTFPPEIPTGTRATAGNAEMTINWSLVPGAKYYNLYVSQQPGVNKSNYMGLPGGQKIPYVNYPFILTNLNNGTALYATVTAVNAYGESLESVEVLSTPQAPAPNLPPSITITNPISGSTFSEPAVVSIMADTSDADGRVTRVQFFNGPALISTDNSSPFSFNWSIPVAGEYSLTARATDNRGAISESSPVNITIARTAKSFGHSVLGPVADSYVRNENHALDNYGSSNLLQVENHKRSNRKSFLTFDLTSITGIVSHATLKVYGGVHATNKPVPVDCVGAANTSWNESLLNWNTQPTLASIIDSVLVTNNTEYLEWDITSWIQEQKSLGNSTGTVALVVSSSSPGVVEFSSKESPMNYPVLRVISETFLPTVTLTSPVNGAAFRTEFSNIQVLANANDVDGTVEEVVFFSGTTLLGSDLASPFMATWLNVPAGSYTLSAIATDDKGVSSPSPLVKVTVDATMGSGLWTHEVQLTHYERNRRGIARLWYDTERIKGLIVVGSIRNGYLFATNDFLRSIARDNELAIILAPSQDIGFSIPNPAFKDEVAYTQMLQSLAEISGKPEIEHAPWILFGHSTDGLFVRNIALWSPEKAAGIIYYKSGNIDNPRDNFFPPLSKIREVPFLAVNGRYEEFGPNGPLLAGEPWEIQWWAVRDSLLRLRKDHFRVSNLVEWYGLAGHRTWSDESMVYMANFVDKVAKLRIPDSYAVNGPVLLNTLEESSGWLTANANSELMDDFEVDIDPVESSYNDWPATERDITFWHLDESLAIDWINYHRAFWGTYE